MADLAENLAAWAAREASVKAVVLIGSRVRAADDAAGGADAASDWDFHVITSQPEPFARSAWTAALGLGAPLAYVERWGVLGSSRKVSAVFAGGELDLVVLPAGRLQLAAMAMSLGLHRQLPSLHRALGDLAIVIRPGYRFLHGAGAWAPFYARVVAEVADPRLSDVDVRRLAEGFVCDFVWLQRKLDRGELVAARRMLHRGLAEVNFQLAHELKLRRGERTFPDARRLERTGTAADLAALGVGGDGSAEAIRSAAAHCAGTLVGLMAGFAGVPWVWPAGIPRA